MKEIDRKFITENILKLLDYSGVADNDFANLIEKSSKTILRIRKGTALFNVESINIAIDFFDKTLDDLNSNNIEFEEGYRNILKQKHKSNTNFYAILDERPTITYAIKYYLLENEEFKLNGLHVGAIRGFFNSFGWDYSSAYISSSMNRNKKQIYIAGTKIVDGNKVNVYQAK